MKVIIFDETDCGKVKDVEPQVVEDRDAAEEAIAPLIDRVYDKVVDVLKDMTIECVGEDFFVVKPDGVKYALIPKSTLVLEPVETLPIKITLD